MINYYQLIFIFRGSLDFKENMLGIEEFRVNLVRSLVPLTDDENFSRLITRGGRLGGMDALEELVQHPDDGRVVFGAENFGYERTILE